jgi:proline dehydrogenase
MYAGSKAFFYAIARSGTLQRFASRYGLATSDSFASRFIAGETVETVIGVSLRLESQDFLVTLDHFEERVRTLEESTAATEEYVRLINVIVGTGIERHILLKLTELGINVDRATCAASLSRRPVMGSSSGSTWRTRRTPNAERTIEIFETLW